MYKYTDEEITKQAFELIDDGYLIGATEENDLPEIINLLDGRTFLKAKTYFIDNMETDIQREILERVKIIYDAEESGDGFKFDDINTILVDGFEWYREDLESPERL